MTADNALQREIEEEVEAVETPPPGETPEEQEEMPLPSDPRLILLSGLFLLILLAALYAASEIMLPIVLAVLLKLLLQPLVRVLDRLRVPHGLGALAAVIVFVFALVGLISALAAPAASWAGKLPSALPELQHQLAFLKSPIDRMQRVVQTLEHVADGTTPVAPAAPAPHAANLMGMVFEGTTTVVAELFTTLLVLFYLLHSGEIFLRRLVEILPGFGRKRQAVELSMHIERNISAYLVTITLINVVVGGVTMLIMWATGVGDPLLWGTLAFVLNYIPFLGPMVAIVIFVLAGIVSLGVTWWALLPGMLYLCVHLLEGEFITPMLMAQRFTINPVAIILALVFWYWMWGVPGAVLAVPLLAMVKLVCDDLKPLRAFGHFLEG